MRVSIVVGWESDTRYTIASVSVESLDQIRLYQSSDPKEVSYVLILPETHDNYTSVRVPPGTRLDSVSFRIED